MSIESEIAEAATGIVERGQLRFFHRSQPDQPLTLDQAGALLHAHDTIEVPAAGAGSYAAVAGLLGLGRVVLYECSSSAGDWLIVLPDMENMFMSQTNRHPRLGFSYSLFENISAWQDWARQEGGRR